jgi:hypothetical protein
MLGCPQTRSEMLAERRYAGVKLQSHKSQSVMRLSQFIKHATNAPKTFFHHLIIWLVMPLNTTKGRRKNVYSTQYCIDKEHKRNKDVSHWTTVIFVQLW